MVVKGKVLGFYEILPLGFTEIFSPKIVASATESGANVFLIDYLGQPAYLAPSPQFYKQIMVGVFEKVYEVGPVFRAETHSTTRHLNEYVSLDVEMGFIKDHFTVMDCLTYVLRGFLVHLSEHCSGELERLEVEQPKIGESIPWIYFPDAQELIYERDVIDARSEPDLTYRVSSAPAHLRHTRVRHLQNPRAIVSSVPSAVITMPSESAATSKMRGPSRERPGSMGFCGKRFCSSIHRSWVQM